MSKRKLNELCLRKWHKPPEYTTRRVGGEDHAPVYYCNVRLPNGIVCTLNSVHGGKATAENVAAYKALYEIGESECKDATENAMYVDRVEQKAVIKSSDMSGGESTITVEGPLALLLEKGDTIKVYAERNGSTIAIN